MAEPARVEALADGVPGGGPGPETDPGDARDLASRGQRSPRWSPLTRLLFRFTFAYLVLYNVPFPLEYVPFAEKLVGPYGELWNKLVPWVGKRVFGVAITVQPNGSGDTTWNYVQVFCLLVIAAAVTIVWTLLDRKRASYPRLYDGLRVYIRFALAAAMIGYGAFKVIQSQFPASPFERLMQPFGDFSPMGILWAFMGASASYNVFAGLAEMIPGLLLTARRTALLGALLSIAVMSNVVMLNFSYDVPVKLYSCHLLAMGLFLIAADLRRLAGLFLFGRAVEPAAYRPLWRGTWFRHGALVLRTVLVLLCVGFYLNFSYDNRREYGDYASPGSPLHGIWNVEELTAAGKVPEGERWRRVIFGYPGSIGIQMSDDSRRRYALKIDPKAKTMTLTRRDDPKAKTVLAYTHPAPELLTLQGTFEKRQIGARLRRIEKPAFLLTSRGFHWINEYPFTH